MPKHRPSRPGNEQGSWQTRNRLQMASLLGVSAPPRDSATFAAPNPGPAPAAVSVAVTRKGSAALVPTHYSVRSTHPSARRGVVVELTSLDSTHSHPIPGPAQPITACVPRRRPSPLAATMLPACLRACQPANLLVLQTQPTEGSLSCWPTPRPETRISKHCPNLLAIAPAHAQTLGTAVRTTAVTDHLSPNLRATSPSACPRRHPPF